MRPEKELMVKELQEQVSGSLYVLLVDYSGLSVAQFAELRKRLAGVNASCHVVKNALLRRAIEAAGLPKPDGSLSGMTAMVVGASNSDISAAAKLLKQFNKEFDKPKFKLGLLGQQMLATAQVSALADLPSLRELRGQLLGVITGPARQLAVLIGTPAGQLARVLKAHADKQPAAASAAPVA
jgi:large subunit ribosomal protein L10